MSEDILQQFLNQNSDLDVVTPEGVALDFRDEGGEIVIYIRIDHKTRSRDANKAVELALKWNKRRQSFRAERIQESQNDLLKNGFLNYHELRQRLNEDDTTALLMSLTESGALKNAEIAKTMSHTIGHHLDCFFQDHLERELIRAIYWLKFWGISSDNANYIIGRAESRMERGETPLPQNDPPITPEHVRSKFTAFKRRVRKPKKP